MLRKATDAAWLAGIIDGEGCLHARLNRRVTVAMVLRVAMCHRFTIMKLKRITGLGHIYNYVARSRNHRPSFVWMVSDQDAATIVQAVLPYLTTKKRQAILFLRINKLHRTKGRARVTVKMLEEREALVEALRQEKHNG